MHCPMLTGKYMLSCTARKEVYVPSIFEFEEYCKAPLHTMCPFYMKMDRKPDMAPRRAAETCQK